MTYSILGRDRANGDLGVAVQSKFPGVRSLVPHGAADVGVVATQAFGNPRHGTVGLQLLRCGATPQQAVDVLLRGDEQGARRQFALLDARGDAAARRARQKLGPARALDRRVRVHLAALRERNLVPRARLRRREVQSLRRRAHRLISLDRLGVARLHA
jgi:uncharacterized Ntn-hydrolase superfamily protein